MPSTLNPAALPIAHTTFLGRTRELDDIRALFLEPGVRLVTLVGTAGVGKTRLAVEAAPLVAGDLKARIVYVSLAATGNDQRVLDLIAHAAGISVRDERELSRVVAAAFDRDVTLLVLDNFEHLIDQSIDIGRLVGAQENLRVLATSRAALEIRGERAYAVDPFVLPAGSERLPVSQLARLDAIRLFEERARAVQHEFRISPANAAAVAAICHRLDGLPLAVELAAARTRMLSPAVLLTRLDRPLEALKSGPRDSPDRHQSLRAALDWSYDLLVPPEQQLFRRLGALRGSFSMAAVEAMLDGIALDPIDAISSLVSKSLVQPANIVRPGGTESLRFQMLVTVREFALERLAESSEFALAHNLFAHHIETIAAEVPPEFPMGPDDEDLAFDIAGADREPVLAVLDWLHRSQQHAELLRLAGVLAPHWFARGALRDAHACLEIALAGAALGDPADRARATVASGMVAIQQGNFAFGESQLLAGLELARGSGLDVWIGQANFSMGVVEQDRGRPVNAITYFEAARAAFLATGMPVFATVALNNLGLVTARARDLRDGLAIIQQARRQHQELGFRFGVALADRYAGQVLLTLGELERARRHLTQSLQLHPALMQGWHIANAVETIAQIEAREGHWRHAALLAAGAGRLREEIGVPLEPALMPAWDRFERELRDRLDPSNLASATAEGRARPTDELIAAAIAGEGAATDEVVTRAADVRTAPHALTARELEILHLLVAGMSNPEIAEALYISSRTVSVHVTHILEKLGVENRSAAVGLALRSGLIVPAQ